MLSIRFVGKRFNRSTQSTCSKPNWKRIRRVVFNSEFDWICLVINDIYECDSTQHPIEMWCLWANIRQNVGINHLRVYSVFICRSMFSFFCHENEQCRQLFKSVFFWWRWWILCVNKINRRLPGHSFVWVGLVRTDNTFSGFFDLLFLLFLFFTYFFSHLTHYAISLYSTLYIRTLHHMCAAQIIIV